MSSEHTITPFAIERVCEPSIDTTQLSLTEVDDTESTFSRTLTKLEGSGIPDLPDVQTGMETGEWVSWDLYLSFNFREDWIPSGYGLGDLVYTTSLLPMEETVLELKTWETDKRMETAEAKEEAHNLSDVKTTTSNARQVTDSVQTKEHTYVDAKAGYSGFGFSAEVKAGWSKDVNTFNQQIGKRSRQDTRRLVNEQKASRRVKMAVSRESGSSQKTTRQLTNPNRSRTLNANFFQVLKEYTVSNHLESVDLVLLGERLPITQAARTEGGDGMAFEDPDTGEYLTWGDLINSVRDPGWVQWFTQRFGVSPIGVLRAGWERPLRTGALVDRPFWKTDPISQAEREAFRDTILQYLRPTVSWVEPDESGTLRWGYEVVEGEEMAFVEYLLSFVPFQMAQIVGIVLDAGFGTKAASQTIANISDTGVSVPTADVIHVPGPFEGVEIEDFREEHLPEHRSKIVKMLDEARETVGPVEIDGEEEYTVTLPTMGVYADVTLGVCSGAEDAAEVETEFTLRAQEQALRADRIRNDRDEMINQLIEDGEELPDLSGLGSDIDPENGPTE